MTRPSKVYLFRFCYIPGDKRYIILGPCSTTRHDGITAAITLVLNSGNTQFEPLQCHLR